MPPSDDETRVSKAAPPTSQDDVTRVRSTDATENPAPPAVPLPSPATGTRIGRYLITGKLGEGGMGLVYEAEQESPRRRVALKVIRGGRLVDDTTRKLFAREADTLARLQHPDIAAIYESGATDDGQLYFAMELVEGLTLAHYFASRPEPSTRDEIRHRLRVFLRIASAVHHAHQRGVIHRDLKPGNVIVGTASAQSDAAQDAPSAERVGPSVKILDFGLARVLDADDAQDAPLTQTGVIKGTLAYMSPEQTKGDPAAIDVRSDVYALGVMLYEALAGTRPYDVPQHSLIEAVRSICETPARSLKTSAPAPALIDTDLETIVGTALQKDPARRYSSAAAFALDIERYLTSQPILARPPSTVYQITMFARRHRGLFAAAAAVALALTAGAVIATSQAFRARAAERDARARLAESNAVVDVLEKMLASADPDEARGRDITVREALDATAKELDRGTLRETPLVEAAVRETLGASFESLSEYEAAETHLRRAIALSDGVEDAPLERHLTARHRLATVLLRTNRLDECQKLIDEIEGRVNAAAPESSIHLIRLELLRGSYLYNRGQSEASLRAYETALELAQDELPEDHELTHSARSNVAFQLNELGREDESIAMYRRALLSLARTTDPLDSTVLRTKKNLAHVLIGAKPNEATALFREALDGWRVLAQGRDSYDVLSGLSALGSALLNDGNTVEGLALLQEALAMAERLFGPDHSEVAFVLEALTMAMQRDQRYDEMLALAQRSLAIRRKVFGDESPASASSLLQVAKARMGQGRLDECERDALEAARIFENAKVAPSNLVEAITTAAVATQNQGRLAEAEPLFRRALQIQTETLGESDPRTISSTDALAAFLFRKGEREESVAMFQRVVAMHREVSGPENPATAFSLAQLGYVLEATGRREEAIGAYQERLAITRKVYPEGHAENCDSLRFLVNALVSVGRADEAEPLAREELAGWTMSGRAESRQSQFARLRLGRVLTALGRFDEAEPLLLHAEAALRALPETPPGDLQFARERIAALYEAKGDAASAARWR